MAKQRPAGNDAVTVRGAEGNEDKLHSLTCARCHGTEKLELIHPDLEMEGEQWYYFICPDDYGDGTIDFKHYQKHLGRQYRGLGLHYSLIRDWAGKKAPLLDLIVCVYCLDSEGYMRVVFAWQKSKRHWNWKAHGLEEKLAKWREDNAEAHEKKKAEREAKRRTYTQASLEAEGFSHIDEVRKYEYDDGGRKDAGWDGTGGDCVVRAVAIATGRPYQEVYDRCAEGNHSGKRGQPFLNGKHYRNRTRGQRTALHGISTKEKWFQDYMKELGFEYVLAPYGQVHVRSDSLPQQGSLILSLERHYAAYVDGVLRDTWDSATIAGRGRKHRKDGITRCVWGYWQRIA